jgi:hypothetical protein
MSTHYSVTITVSTFAHEDSIADRLNGSGISTVCQGLYYVLVRKLKG